MTQIFPYEMTAHLKVIGEDSADFLQGQFSNDLHPYAPGEAVYGLWLDARGKVVADSWIYCDGPESFHVYSEHCSPSVIAEKLERHIIADDVEIEILPPASSAAVIGKERGDLAEGANTVILPGRRSAEPSLECVFETAEAREDFLRKSEYEIVSEKQIHDLRMDAGFPAIPFEIGPGELPGEGGLDKDAVAFNKGCFIGQEVVARMRNVGKATRGLYLVRGDGDTPERPQALIGGNEKVVGELRTAFAKGGGWRGVALLKVRHATSPLHLKDEARSVDIVSEFNR